MQKQLQLARGGDGVATILTRAGRLAYWTKGKGAPVVLNSAGKEVFASQMNFLAGARARNRRRRACAVRGAG